MSETALQPMASRKLPSLLELRDSDSLELVGRQNDLNILLNAEPKPAWIRKNKFAGNSDYLPIERVEWLLTSIFVHWKTEVLAVQMIANAVCVTVRLHYLNPVSGEWEWRDGVGAANLQTDKGSGAADTTALKSHAVEMGAPKAKTEAIKDAAGDLGRLFGRDLNRKDSPDYQILMGAFDASPISDDEHRELCILMGPSTLSEKDLSEFFEVGSLAELPKGQLASARARILSNIQHNGSQAH